MAEHKAAVFVVTIISVMSVVDVTRADHESEKKKIYDRFEVVSFGPSQRFTENLLQAAKAIASEGANLQVYRDRYKDLKSHWDDAEKEFTKHNVDIKNEHVYFSFIQWVQESKVPGPRPPGVPASVVTDDFIQFYVAARKKVAGNGGVLDNGAVVSLENCARIARFLDIDAKKGTVMPLQQYTKAGGCDWIIHNIGDGYFALENRFSHKFLDVDGKHFGGLMFADNTKSRGCHWRIFAVDIGHYKFVNRHWSEKMGKEIALDIDGKTNLPIVAPYAKSSGADWKLERH